MIFRYFILRGYVYKTALEQAVCLLLQFWHGLHNILFYTWQGKEK